MAQSETDPKREVDSWVDEHGDYLYRYALMRLRDPEGAADAVQETFVAALGALARREGTSSVRTWLVGILKHKIVDRFRRAARERDASGLGDPEESVDDFFAENGHWGVEPGEWQTDPGATVERKEFWEILRGCLAKLPGRTGDAFTMRVIEGMSSEEVNKVLGTSATNLWVMLHRARVRLRRCLELRWFGGAAEGGEP